MAMLDQHLSDFAIQLAPFAVGRTDDERPQVCAMRRKVIGGDKSVPLFWHGGFPDPLPLLKEPERLPNVAAGGMLDRAFQLGIALTPNDVEPRDVHLGANQLANRVARLDRLVLALVADEDDPIDAGALRYAQDTVHLTGREQARFVDDPELLLADFDPAAFEQAGDGSRLKLGFGERFDAAAGRSEAAHGVAVLFGELADRANRRGFGGAGTAFDGGNPVARRQRDPGGLDLVREKTAPNGPARDLLGIRDRVRFAHAGPHQFNIFVFQ